MKKTKILQVVNNLNCGGAETMIMNIYRNIDKEKFEFDFLCLDPLTNGKYEDEIKKIGGNIYKVQKRNFKQMYKIMKQNNYDAIHSHIMFYSSFICIISKIARIKKIIVHSHSSSDMKKENCIRKKYIKISRYVINKYSNIKVSCGQKAGEYLYGKKQRFIIFKNGIDLQKFTNVTQEQINNLKNELKIDKEDFIIGHVGSFLEVKNQEYFIDLAKELQRENKKFKIVLVGYGPRYNYIAEMIEKNHLQQYFIMPKTRNDINIFMKMFDIFIMPSLYEGFPLVVVEALAGDNICFLSDKISKETNIIDNRIQFFNLNTPKCEIVQIIKEKIKNKRNMNIDKILTENGFSAKKMVDDISNIYIS